MINTTCLMSLYFLDTLLIVKLSCILKTSCLMALYFQDTTAYIGRKRIKFLIRIIISQKLKLLDEISIILDYLVIKI
jgi:hypothetical protein